MQTNKLTSSPNTYFQIIIKVFILCHTNYCIFLFCRKLCCFQWLTLFFFWQNWEILICTRRPCTLYTKIVDTIYLSSFSVFIILNCFSIMGIIYNCLSLRLYWMLGHNTADEMRMHGFFCFCPPSTDSLASNKIKII